jgi:hypothetical protein
MIGMTWITTHWVAIAVGTALFVVGITVGATAGKHQENRSHRTKEPVIVTVTRVTTIRVTSSGTFLADR